MKLTNLVTYVFVFALIAIANPSEAKSIRISRDLWENPRFRLIETLPIQLLQEDELSTDNVSL